MAYQRQASVSEVAYEVATTSAFLWRYEPVIRRTGKSDDWITIFFARIIRMTVQKFQLFWVIFCIIIFFIELWHILILWLATFRCWQKPFLLCSSSGRLQSFILNSTTATHCTIIFHSLRWKKTPEHPELSCSCCHQNTKIFSYHSCSEISTLAENKRTH